MILDCQSFDFKPSLSAQRIANAEAVVPLPILKRLLCFALFLLGANRSAIACSLDLSLDTAKSVLKTIQRDGLSALEDRRQRHSSFLPPLPTAQIPAAQVDLSQQADALLIQLGTPELTLTIPLQNHLQRRTVLLSLLKSGLLTNEQVAAQLDLSTGHAAHLAQELHDKDAGVLLDKRQGQQNPYRVDRDMLRLIIEQFVIDIVSQGTTSGKQLCQHLHARCDVELKERTARHHMEKLGMTELKKTLPQHLSALKKTP